MCFIGVTVIKMKSFLVGTFRSKYTSSILFLNISHPKAPKQLHKRVFYVHYAFVIEYFIFLIVTAENLTSFFVVCIFLRGTIPDPHHRLLWVNESVMVLCFLSHWTRLNCGACFQTSYVKRHCFISLS
jgi:hypothetical protein